MRRLPSLLTALASALAVLTPPTAVADEDDPRHQIFRFKEELGRETPELQDAFRKAAAQAARSTVRIRAEGRTVALGVAVHAAGYLITKASELTRDGTLEVEFGNGLRLPARILDRLDAYDLALLKVEAEGLTPIRWSEEPAPPPGTFLAAPSPEGDALAIGVASVSPRSLYEAPRGFLGVRLRDESGVIERVYAGGAAAEAGLQENDELIAIGGRSLATARELIDEIGRHRPGQEVLIRFRRSGQEQEVTVSLLDRREFLSRLIRGEDPMELMQGRLSGHRHGYFNALQHDLVLEPEECGGPLIDLDGRVVGLDIARAGRTESFAIPAEDLRALTAGVTSGRFSLPDVSGLLDQLKRAELALARAQEVREQAAQALARAKRLVESLPPTRQEKPVAQHQPAPAEKKPEPAGAP